MDDFLVIAAGTRLPSQVARHDPGAFEESLAEAKAQYGHAMCHCTAPARKLVIRKLGPAHHLAVWPEDGPNHHVRCAFYRDAAHHPDTTLLPALVETESGLDLKLGFPLEEARREAGAAAAPDKATGSPGAPKRPAAAARPRRGVPLTELLSLLWSHADLARWMPGWSRDYWRMHKQLHASCAEIAVANRPLCDLLFVPPPADGPRKAAALANWEAFSSPMASATSASMVTRLLLGEVRSIEPSKFGWALRLAQFSPSIYLGEEDYQLIAMEPAYQLAVACTSNTTPETPEPPRARLIALCRVRMSKSGYLRLVEWALMCTETHFLPIRSAAERQLVTYLVKAGRCFAHQAATARGDASYELLDTDPPTGLHVDPEETAAESSPAHSDPMVLPDGEAISGQSWRWHPGQAWKWPTLPGPSSRNHIRR